MVLETAANTTLDMSDFDRQIAMHRNEERTALQVLATTEAEGKALRARYEKIKSTPVGECSECGQPVTQEHLAREATKLEPELERLRVLYSNHNAEVVRVRALVQAAEQEKERQRQIHYEADKENREKLREAQEQMRTINEAKNYIAQAEAHCTQLRTLMATAQQKVNPWRAKQAEMLTQKATLEAQVAELVNGINSLEAERLYIEFWVDGFGPKGLKSYILDSRLQEMTDAANEWVKLLTGGTIWVRFETQTQGRSTKKLSNKINLRLWRYNRDGTITERNYRSWSGGEKKRVSWAVDFGLSRLVAARATKRYDTLILDEVFTHVDRAGGEAVVEMLNKLRDEKSSIFVVEQNSDFQNHFEETLVVRKEHGCSRVVREDEDDVQGVQGQRQEAPRTEPAAKPKRKKKGKRVSTGAPRRKKRAPRSARGSD
jgi:DNA repair exonuclease SbcCD ATPase subunit